VPLGIACTHPPSGKEPGVKHVETLYLDMIRARSATSTSRTSTSPRRRSARRLEARLREPDPPEIVVVTRLLSHGWLESTP
jgi:hypothetical protein